jgi:hypothetical protein
MTSKFGDLGRNEALVNSVNSWLGTIKQHGIDAALDRI